MEHLFSPCTRLRDRLVSLGEPYRGPRRLWFQELNLDVSTDEFLSDGRALTYADLYAMLGNEDAVAWLTPHATVTRTGGYGVDYWEDLEDSFYFSFNADSNVIDALACSSERLLEIYDVVTRLLAASVVHLVVLRNTVVSTVH
jgi:hypothetical protein